MLSKKYKLCKNAFEKNKLCKKILWRLTVPMYYLAKVIVYISEVILYTVVKRVTFDFDQIEMKMNFCNGYESM
jgi:hypothetical protein